MSTGRSDLRVDSPLLPLPLLLKPHPRARRLKLRIAPAGDALHLTLPPHGNRRRAIAWAEQQAPWVAAQLGQRMAVEPLEPGGLVPIDGIDHLIDWSPDRPRRVELAGNRLLCGGPIDGLDRRLLNFLRTRARDCLSVESAQMAQRAGVTVAAVAVGDAATRWGSCSARGVIRYNWRLVMAPPTVRTWVVAHEVAHRVHMNHGPAFKALEATLFDGDVAEARALLRRWGPRLKRIGLRPLA